MWHNKRQSRATKTAFNGYPRLLYSNLWQNAPFPDRTKLSMGYRGKHVGRPRSRTAGGAPIYGRMVHKAPAGSRWRNAMRGPSRMRAFDEFSQNYGILNFIPSNRGVANHRAGGKPPKSQIPNGSFEMLKHLIQTERARELQEQHAIEEIKAGIAGKQRANEGKEEEEERSQLLRQHFHKSFPFYEITRKVNYDNDQRRYPAPNIPNPGTAWSRSEPITREYMSP